MLNRKILDEASFDHPYLEYRDVAGLIKNVAETLKDCYSSDNSIGDAKRLILAHSTLRRIETAKDYRKWLAEYSFCVSEKLLNAESKGLCKTDSLAIWVYTQNLISKEIFG